MLSLLQITTEIKCFVNQRFIETFVTGYWKTDHNVIFGQLLVIGPANSHTHTLPVHCCNNGLS